MKKIKNFLQFNEELSPDLLRRAANVARDKARLLDNGGKTYRYLSNKFSDAAIYQDWKAKYGELLQYKMDLVLKYDLNEDGDEIFPKKGEIMEEKDAIFAGYEHVDYNQLQIFLSNPSRSYNSPIIELSIINNTLVIDSKFSPMFKDRKSANNFIKMFKKLYEIEVRTGGNYITEFLSESDIDFTDINNLKFDAKSYIN